MEKDSKMPSQQEPGKGQCLLNILKLVFLVGVLVAAWHILDSLISK